MLTVNESFSHVYVINLNRKPDRELSMHQKMRDQEIVFERISAVDGLTAKIPKRCITDRMSKGAWGYLLTWKKILEKSLADGSESILCFDDDVIFHRDFKVQFNNVMTWLENSKWRVINLGASQHAEISWPQDFYYHPELTDGSFATAVHRSVFQELLMEIKKVTTVLTINVALPINTDLLMPFDSGPLRNIYGKYKDECYVIYPNLVISDVRNSTIRGPRNQVELSNKFGWNLKDYHWPPSYDKVSIIISCYNAQNSIGKSVLSARLQDYPNCEVIVVDDNSTDKSQQILKECLQSDSYVSGTTYKLHPIRVLRNEKNLGCYATRNVGITASTGDWITFQDADDISVSERITIQFNCLMRYKVLFTTSLILRSHLPNFSTIYQFDYKNVMKTLEGYRIHHNYRKEYQYCCKAILGMVTTFMSRTLFYELGLYWPLPCIADAEYCERILFHKMGKLFSEDESVVGFLSQNQHIAGIYYKVQQILYVSEEMKANNITSQINNSKGQQIKKAYIAEWRNRLIGKNNFVYPKLDELFP